MLGISSQASGALRTSVLLYSAKLQGAGTEKPLQSSYLVQPDDVWVAKHLHDLNFSEDLLQVLFIQLRLINYLYSNLGEGEKK